MPRWVVKGPPLCPSSLCHLTMTHSAVSQAALAGSQQEPDGPVKGWSSSQATAGFLAEPVPQVLPGKHEQILVAEEGKVLPF